jgi:hypothetical protein
VSSPLLDDVPIGANEIAIDFLEMSFLAKALSTTVGILAEEAGDSVPKNVQFAAASSVTLSVPTNCETNGTKTILK